MKCLFCHINKERIILENELAYAVMDHYPVSEGHALFIPKRHFHTFFEAEDAEITALYHLLQEGKKLLDEQYHPEGYNVWVNVGKEAGQSIMHLHIHLVPRYKGDEKALWGADSSFKERLEPR